MLALCGFLNLVTIKQMWMLGHTCSHIHACTHACTYAHTHTHTLTHSPTHSLSPTHPLTHSLMYKLKNLCPTLVFSFSLTLTNLSKDGVRLPTWQGNWKRLLMQSSHPMQCTCTCTCTGVCAHTRWPSECSAEERYNNNNKQQLWSLYLEALMTLHSSSPSVSSAMFSLETSASLATRIFSAATASSSDGPPGNTQST